MRVSSLCVVIDQPIHRQSCSLVQVPYTQKVSAQILSFLLLPKLIYSFLYFDVIDK